MVIVWLIRTIHTLCMVRENQRKISLYDNKEVYMAFVWIEKAIRAYSQKHETHWKSLIDVSLLTWSVFGC